MDTITTTKLTDWFALQTGDWVVTPDDNQFGIVRAIDEYATHIELRDGQYAIPHSRAQAARRYFSQLVT